MSLLPGGKLRASFRGLEFVKQAKASFEFRYSQNVSLSLLGSRYGHPGQSTPKQETNQQAGH